MKKEYAIYIVINWSRERKKKRIQYYPKPFQQKIKQNQKSKKFLE